MDLLVTTPKKEMVNSAAEAADVVQAGKGTYFRYLGRSRPAEAVMAGSRIYYTEDGFIRGFLIIREFKRRFNQKCDTTGRMWPNGWYVYMDATTWQWIDPILYRGFQGPYRYFRDDLYGAKVKIIGDYRMPKPIAIIPKG